MIPFCRPLGAGTVADAEKGVVESLEVFPFVELWLGGIADATPDWGRLLAERFPHRCVFVLRIPGKPPQQLPTELRDRYLDALLEAPALIDVDWNEVQQLRIPSPQRREKLIISMHDYTTTPPLQSLRELCHLMGNHAPFVRKIATYCHSDEDALRLLQLMAECANDRPPPIILGMGTHGRILRILSAHFGAPLVYAPSVLRESNADGQLDRQAFQRLLNEIRGARRDVSTG